MFSGLLFSCPFSQLRPTSAVSLQGPILLWCTVTGCVRTCVAHRVAWWGDIFAWVAFCSRGDGTLEAFQEVE